MKPRRIQLKRTKGYRMPPNSCSVARPSKYSNPMRGDKAACVAWFRHAISKFPVPSVIISEWIALGGNAAVLIALAGRVKSVLADLRGKNLGCFCRLCERHKDGLPLGTTCNECEPCHVDPLLEVANGGPA